MRQLTTQLVDQFAGTGECEFVADFGDHYPVQVIAHLMGVPREDHPLFAKRGDTLTHLLSMEVYQYRAQIEVASDEMGAYLEALVAERRRQPRQDLVSELIAAQDGGDRLNDNELMTLLAGLLFAGYDTTRNQLAVAMTVFAERADDWAALAARPELAPAAVEEVMRTAGIVSVTPRIATEEAEIDGWRIPAGSVVMVSLAGANRDPAVYPDPGRFDMYAERPDGQVTFGGGAHHCLGANLARAEMQEALPLLARAMPNLRVAETPEWRSPLVGISGPTKLRLAFGP
jgi:cytochrome P450